MMKYFIDTQGIYIGGFDGVEPPDGSIEVSYPPNDVRAKWLNNAWVEPTPNKSLNETLETKFGELLEKHRQLDKELRDSGQAGYLTGAIINSIFVAKNTITTVNEIDPTGYMGKSVLLELQLPNQMKDDQQALINLFPQ